MNIRRITPPETFSIYAPEDILGCYAVNGFLQVFVTRDNGLLHMSVAHPRRYPTWDELRDLRYELLPDDKTFGMLLPPKGLSTSTNYPRHMSASRQPI